MIEMDSRKRKITAMVMAVVLLVVTAAVSYDCGRRAGTATLEAQATENAQVQMRSDSISSQSEEAADKSQEWDGMTAARKYEYLGSGLAWQFSAEKSALVMQIFKDAKIRIDEMVAKCNDPNDTDWEMLYKEDGTVRMFHNQKRVALVSDVDDTLVDGACYSADIVGRDGDYNNAAFARFLMSDDCTALPGAVEFIQYCTACGIEVFYVTNRYDEGYKVGQSDSYSSYEISIEDEGKGIYTDASGEEIGSTIYQVYGKSMYDISLESMRRLGFSVDEEHLIINDMKLNGSSKESARKAIAEGSDSYPNGQRSDQNAADKESGEGKAVTHIKIVPHEVEILMGDNLNDFSDDFSAEGLDAVSRTDITLEYADNWGTKWFLMPNAVYGDSLNYAVKYDLKNLFDYYGYTYSGTNLLDD